MSLAHSQQVTSVCFVDFGPVSRAHSQQGSKLAAVQCFLLVSKMRIKLPIYNPLMPVMKTVVCLLGYRYFSQRAEKKKREEEEDSDAGSVSDSEFDAFLGQLLLLLIVVCVICTHA